MWILSRGGGGAGDSAAEVEVDEVVFFHLGGFLSSRWLSLFRKGVRSSHAMDLIQKTALQRAYVAVN